MSRVSASTLDHQWDPYQILDVQRDRRCVGWAHSKGRKCRHTVNWHDMDAFYGLLTDMSSQPLDAAALQPRLQELASLGLCKQVHRRAQVDGMVDDWTKKIRTAVRMAELQAATQHRRAHTRSTTASFASTETFPSPASNSSRSSTSTISAASSPATQAEIESTLRCLEANREQERILVDRLASLQSPGAPRLEPSRPATRASITSVSSLHLSNAPSAISSHTVRSHTAMRSSRSTSARTPSSRSRSDSSSSNSSAPPDQRRPPHGSADSPLQTRSTASRHHAVSSPSSTPSAPPNANPTATAQVLSPPSPPRCTIAHVRRRPVSQDCPICYESMQEQTELSWCKSRCGQTVHKACMDVWLANCIADGAEGSCTMCRTAWKDECEC